MTHALLIDLDGVIRTWCSQDVSDADIRFGLPPGANVAGAVRWWSATPGEVDRAVLGLVAACRQRVRVVLVTNATSRLPDDLRRLGIDTAFDHVINSAVVGAARPDAAIFAAALAVAGIDAAKALFVDDTPEHVEAARRLGSVAHRYTGVAALAGEAIDRRRRCVAPSQCWCRSLLGYSLLAEEAICMQHIRKPPGQANRRLHKESGWIGWPFPQRSARQSSEGWEAAS